MSACPLSVPSLHAASLALCPVSLAPLSALSHLPSLSTPSHFYYLGHIIFPLILWLFSQPCSSHSSLSSASLDTVVTIMSLFYPVLLYVFYHTTWVNYYLDTLFSHLGNYTIMYSG